MLGGGVDAATLVAALGAGPPPRPDRWSRRRPHRQSQSKFYEFDGSRELDVTRILMSSSARPARKAPATTRLVYHEDSTSEEAPRLPPKKKAAPKPAATKAPAAAPAPIKLTLTLGGAALPTEPAAAEAQPAAPPAPEASQHSKEELQLLQKYAALREASCSRTGVGGAGARAGMMAASSVEEAVAALHGVSSKEASALKRPSAKRGRSMAPQAAGMGGFGTSAPAPPLPHGFGDAAGGAGDWD